MSDESRERGRSGASRAHDVTRLLGSWRDGDESALDRVIPLVYDELRLLAQKVMRGERRDHTLRPTALVHEVYDRLAGAQMTIDDRGHFLSIAARIMRRVLVDHARGKLRDKRGGGAMRVTLGEDAAIEESSFERILDVDRALVELGELDERKVRVLEMHYFAGMTVADIASNLEVSKMTVNRDLSFARAWLRRRLAEYE